MKPGPLFADFQSAAPAPEPTGFSRWLFSNNSVVDLIVARYHADGSLDASFGAGGFVVESRGVFGLLEVLGNSLLLQPDGKLVATDDGGQLFRFNPDGTLDMSFGDGGRVGPNFGGPSDLSALVLQPDGKLVAAGAAGVVGLFRRGDFLLARFNPDGTLDPSFGSGGALRTRGRSLFGLQALALQADGKLVAAGEVDASGDSDFALARYVTTDEPLVVPPKCGGRRATILGTSRKDTIRGTRGADVILGLGGNDTIRGLQGNDTICGGPGLDTLIGNEGNDRLLGEGQNDKLFGDNGSDRLDGGSGRDACRTGETARRCEGKPASGNPTPGERPKDPPKRPCPPAANFPCS